MTLRVPVILTVGLLLAACSTAPSGALPTAGAASPMVSDPLPTASTAEPTESTQSSPGVAVAPGRPFDAQQILDAMRSSRRPGGVPDQLENLAVATAIADAIWTFDGEPWTEIVAGGSCGPQTCTLEVSGRLAGATDEDLWIFEVTPSSGAVTVMSSLLRGLDQRTLDAADAILRADPDDAPPSDAFRSSARWLPPPDAGRVVLSYRRGNEEGDCGIDYTVDLRRGSVVDRAVVSC